MKLKKMLFCLCLIPLALCSCTAEPGTPSQQPSGVTDADNKPQNPSTPSLPSNPTDNPGTGSDDKDDPVNPNPTDPTKPTEPTEPEVDPTDIVLPDVDTSNAVLKNSLDYKADAFYQFETKTSAHLNYNVTNAAAAWCSNGDGSYTYIYRSENGALNLNFSNEHNGEANVYSADGQYYTTVSNVFDKLSSTASKTHLTTVSVICREENGIYSGEFNLEIALTGLRLEKNNNFLSNTNFSSEGSLTLTYEGTFTDKTINYFYYLSITDKRTTTNDVESTIVQRKYGTFTKDTPVITMVDSNPSFDLSMTATSSLTWTSDSSATTLNMPDTDAIIDNLEFDITFTQNTVTIVLDSKEEYGSGELIGLIKDMTF